MAMRLTVGIIGLIFLIPLLLWGGELGVEVLIALATVICLDEFARMAFPDNHPKGLSWLLLAGGGLYVARLYGQGPVADVAPYLAGVATFVMVLLTPGDDLSLALDEFGRYLIGLLWVVGCIAFLVELRRLDHGLAWIFVVLTISWAGDTGAYFSGKFLGNRKLYPLVSPKKTWAGFWGGIGGAIIGVFVVKQVGFPTLDVLDCVVLGAVGCTMGVLGDLSESLVKRAFGIKDSGWILPGHGGLLDRIDSVLFVAPVVYVWAVGFAT